MPIEYPGIVPDLLTRFGLNPLDFSSWTDLLRELQAALTSLGTNPQGASGTVTSRIAAVETELASPALVVATIDSANITNTVTETAFNTGKYTVLANSAAVGRTYRITAGGVVSTGSSPGTLTFRLRWGNVNTDPAPITIGPTSTLPATLSNAAWFFEGLWVVRSPGASGAAIATGICILPVSPPDGLGQIMAGAPTTSTLTTINTTLTKDLTLFAKWSIAAVANTIRLTTFVVEQVN